MPEETGNRSQWGDMTMTMERVLLNQQQLYNQMATHIQTQDRVNSEMFNNIENRMQEQDRRSNEFRRATNTLIQGLQSGQTELEQTLREQGNHITQHDIRINEVGARVDQVQDEMRSEIKNLLERFNDEGQSNAVAEAGPDLDQAEEVAPLVLPSPGDDGIATRDNNILSAKRVVMKGAFEHVEGGANAVLGLIRHFGGDDQLKIYTKFRRDCEYSV